MAAPEEVYVQLGYRYLATTLFLALLLSAVPVRAQRTARVAPAEILIIHAKIYTMDEKKPWAQSLAIRKGKIEAIGSDEQVGRMRGIGTKMIDAGGKLVLPGFTDCHIHLLEGGFSLKRINLEGAKDVAEIQNRLKTFADQHPEEAWLLGRGWTPAMFGPENLPHKKYLDELFPIFAVFLESDDGHTFWANSRALSLAGITKTTPNPPNGEIVRDPKTGEATGVLKESAADLVRKVVPKPNHVEQLNALRAGIKWASQNGITRVHTVGNEFELLDLLQELRDDKQLWVRFHVAYSVEPPDLRPQDLEAIESAHKKFRDEWIDVHGVKFQLDGGISSHTAALLEPYSDDPSSKGALNWDPEKFKSAVAELDKKDLQIYTQAVGDAAVRAALDGYEYAEMKNHSKKRRHRVENVQLISTPDIPRFGKLGVIASMQPLQSYPDAISLRDLNYDIGPERSERAWVWKSIAQYGGRYAFGSDWPVVSVNPWKGIQTAVTRQTSGGRPPGGFLPAQRLTVPQALQGYTIEAAYAGHREKNEGSLETGKVADVIMVDRNILEVDPHTIDQTKVVLTIVGGKIVYEASTP
jgi:hypothetical protein